MTEKRFVYYEHKGSEYILDTPNTELDFIEMLGDALETEEIVDKLNELHEKKEILEVQLESATNEIKKLMSEIDILTDTCHDCCKEIRKENKELKQVIKEVLKLLEEEVDLFSYKATEHDINAYIELRELDNKDAYYMAISTKKAIKLLKEMMCE